MKDTGADLLTYDEAATYCRLRSRYKLRIAVRRRELEAVRLGFRTIRFRRSELDRWLASKRTKVIR